MEKKGIEFNNELPHFFICPEHVICIAVFGSPIRHISAHWFLNVILLTGLLVDYFWYVGAYMGRINTACCHCNICFTWIARKYHPEGL